MGRASSSPAAATAECGRRARYHAAHQRRSPPATSENPDPRHPDYRAHDVGHRRADRESPRVPFGGHGKALGPQFRAVHQPAPSTEPWPEAGTIHPGCFSNAEDALAESGKRSTTQRFEGATQSLTGRQAITTLTISDGERAPRLLPIALPHWSTSTAVRRQRLESRAVRATRSSGQVETSLTPRRRCRPPGTAIPRKKEK